MSDNFDFVYQILRDAVLEMPTEESPKAASARKMIQSLLDAEYITEVESGKYKYTSTGIAHLMSRVHLCDGPPPDAISINAKVSPRIH